MFVQSQSHPYRISFPLCASYLSDMSHFITYTCCPDLHIVTFYCSVLTFFMLSPAALHTVQGLYEEPEVGLSKEGGEGMCICRYFFSVVFSVSAAASEWHHPPVNNSINKPANTSLNYLQVAALNKLKTSTGVNCVCCALSLRSPERRFHLTGCNLIVSIRWTCPLGENRSAVVEAAAHETHTRCFNIASYQTSEILSL